MERDGQKTRVYDWETKSVNSINKLKFSFEDIPDIIEYVWHAEGLKKPPKVLPLSPTATATHAQRGINGIEFSTTKRTEFWVILHELAHQMNQYPTGEHHGAYHGRVFMGLYMQLLCRHLFIPMPLLISRAKKAKLTFNLKAITVQKRIELKKAARKKK